MTSASHAEGPGFDPRSEYIFLHYCGNFGVSFLLCLGAC
jgi:hypothetical protein